MQTNKAKEQWKLTRLRRLRSVAKHQIIENVDFIQKLLFTGDDTATLNIMNDDIFSNDALRFDTSITS